VFVFRFEPQSDWRGIALDHAKIERFELFNFDQSANPSPNMLVDAGSTREHMPFDQISPDLDEVLDEIISVIDIFDPQFLQEALDGDEMILIPIRPRAKSARSAELPVIGE
jgi:hypothetical protein